MWSIASEKLASYVHGDVIVVISPDADINRIFAQNELPKLLNNPDVHTINGILKEDLKLVYETHGLDSAMKNVVITGSAMLETLEEGVDSLGNKVYKTDRFLSVVDGVVGKDFPAGTTGIISHAEQFHVGGSYYDSITNIASDIKANALDFSVKGAFHKIGVGAELFIVGIAVLQANESYAAGNKVEAEHIMEDWAAAFIGRVGGGIIFIKAFSPIIALLAESGTPLGVIAAGFITIAAGITGSILGEKDALYLLHKGEELGLYIADDIHKFSDMIDKTWPGIADSMLAIEDTLSSAYHSFLDSVAAALIAPPTRSDPLIIDMNGDGIKLDSFTASNALFDLNGDGTPETPAGLRLTLTIPSSLLIRITMATSTI